MKKKLVKVLPLAAAFLAGAVAFTALNVGAGPGDCDWSFRSDYTSEHEGVEGAPTPEEALRALTWMSRDVTAPETAVRSDTGDDRFIEIGTDSKGGVGFNIYLDGVRRMEVYITKSPIDGTYYIDGFSTCLGV